MAGTARSGDRDGGQSGSAYLKVPAGRRRQTAVMLLLNLLTGPTIFLSAFFFLWWVLPFGTYLVALYFVWVAVDNFTRPMPSYKRVSQAWRNNSMYVVDKGLVE